MKKILFVFVLLTCATVRVHANEREVILDLPTMNCPMCPITVSKALTKVSGVIQVDVSYDTKQATVIFEAQETSIAALVHATTNAGYPSTVAEGAPND